MPSEKRMRVSESGRIEIPARFRKALGINVGDEVILRIEDGELRTTTLKRRLERAQQSILRHIRPGRSLVANWSPNAARLPNVSRW